MKYLLIVQYYCNCQTNKYAYSCQNSDYAYSGHTLFWPCFSVNKSSKTYTSYGINKIIVDPFLTACKKCPVGK